MSTDIELLERWQSGEKGAGAELFERHYASVLRFFHNKCGEQARDLIQRTFLRCLEARERIHPGSNFRAYLFGIARNVLLEHFRVARRHGALFDAMQTTAADISPMPTPGTVLARQRELQLLMQALRRIPIEHQIALELFYWEQMQGKEIAAVLGIPEGTVRTRLRRARQLLILEIEALSASSAEFRSTTSSLDAWADRLRAAVDRDAQAQP
ncbi:MAG: sigma-70 family RNA polymerase sigma factor [Nannocystaceae bacterium]